LVGLLRLLGLKLMRPEYRALLRGPYGASYMGLRPIPATSGLAMQARLQ
jgi:hypothetical protein